MTQTKSTALSNKLSPDKILKGAGAFWFITAALGQALFTYFIVKFYYTSTLSGQYELWNRRDIITGFTHGDSVGNNFFAAHVLVAGLITLSGILQLIPQFRNRFRAFHRLSGRFFIFAVVFISLNGLWLVWVRQSYLNIIGAINISILALLLMFCATMTIKNAMARRFQIHEIWAMRTFLLASGVWFQRIGYMAWIVINRGAPGIGDKMDGPFDIFIGFAVYLIPLGVYELYRGAKKTKSKIFKYSAAFMLFVCAIITAVGVFGTYAIMWHKFL